MVWKMNSSASLAYEKMNGWHAQELEVYSIGAAEGQNPKKLRLLAKRVIKDMDYGV